MHALYKQGHSLAEVGAAFGVTRQAVYKRLQARGLPLRAKPPAVTITWNGKRYSKRTNGYYACTTGCRRYLHRDVWEGAHGPIPDGLEVHHCDGDKEHNSLSNFELLTSAAHGERHGFAGNQSVPSIGYRPIREVASA